MASLQQLLAEEGFEREKFAKTQKRPVKFTGRKAPDDSIALPIYICRDRKTFDFSNKKAFSRSGSSVVSLKRVGSGSERSKNSESLVAEEGLIRTYEPAMDEIAIKAVISILSGYIGRYLKDENYREFIRDKCYSCLERKKKDSDNGIFANMELGIESIEKLLADHQGTKKELRMKTLRNSIRLLSIVASLNTKSSKNGFTSGTPNSYLSACAQLYLSIVYKLDKNDRISARHLLQVFCDSPSLARTHLLPDLWEHVFLPHLLHLKIWYAKEVEFLSESNYGEKEKKMKALSQVYNDQMDIGTAQFALYYKQWLKIGGQAPPVPSVPLPSKPSYQLCRRKSSDSYSSQSSINKNLYKTVFGQNLERRSVDLDDRRGVSINTWDLEEQEKVCTHEDNLIQHGFAQSGVRTRRRSSSQIYRNQKDELWSETQKSDFFRFLTCQTAPKGSFMNGVHIVRNGSIRKEEKINAPSSDISRAIATICSSASLGSCEIAIRVMAKAWLDTQGNHIVESALSQAAVIEGMLEVLFVSNDDEILELTISILAELAARGEVNKQVMLNSDPQLEIFLKLLRSTSLFLKAAVLLYLLKPKSKQMISIEWVPLFLRVLEFGGQLQTLFTVRCSPKVAAFYFLEQILTGFDDEDRNLENAREVVSLGGLSLLVRSLEKEDIHERSNAALIIYCCIRADGSCRNYLVDNLNKASIVELFTNQKRPNGCALALLTELLCINSRIHITKLLNGLINEGGSLNTLQILLVYLQRAPPEERPLLAAALLQLDLMGDLSKSSMYREEAIDAIIASLDCQSFNEKVQEQSARALLMLGGRFFFTGEASTENWLLKQAGFDDTSNDSFRGKDIIIDMFMLSNEEEEATENWQGKVATVLLISGNKRLLAALSDCIANGIPRLARASLVTVSWMSCFLPSIEDELFRSTACLILMPQLLKSLNSERELEDRVLASFTLLSLTKSSDCISRLSLLDEKLVLVGFLHDLSLVTWTATELISIITYNTRLP